VSTGDRVTGLRVAAALLKEHAALCGARGHPLACDVLANEATILLALADQYQREADDEPTLPGATAVRCPGCGHQWLIRR